MTRRYTIGLCATYHDPALAVVDESGCVQFAEATERPLQIKRALNCEPDRLELLPALLARHCPEVEEVVIALNWRAHRPLYERGMATLGQFSPAALAGQPFKRLRALFDTRQIHQMLACQTAALQHAGVQLTGLLRRAHPHVRIRIDDHDHHDCHAAFACLSSPYRDAAGLVVDSWGETGGLAAYRWQDGVLKRLFTARGLESSLGFLYMKLTELCGFDWTSGEEWKVMGLAPYGKVDPPILDLLRSIVRLDGLQPRMPPASIFFDRLTRLESYRRPSRAPPEAAADLARTGQEFFAELMTGLLETLHAQTSLDKLCLGGGCALNSSYNGRILGTTPFRALHVPSAPADDGTAIGAAWLSWLRDHPGQRPPTGPLSPALGSEIDAEDLNHLLRYSGLAAEYHPEDLPETVARLIAQGHIVAWVQGRAEFGPRALGQRSLLADPRDPTMPERLNATVKFRERFRPFAPAILDEHGTAWFENYQFSPYMERTLRVRTEFRSRIPAVVHVDGTGRLQSVTHALNPRFHALLSAFHRQTDVPILLNTSLNVMGKPIAHSVQDAAAVFLGSGVDVLVIGDHLFRKASS